MVMVSGPTGLLLGEPALLPPQVCRLPGTRPGIDAELARTQWTALRDALQALDAPVHVLPPATPTTCFVRDAALAGPGPRGASFVTARLDDARVDDPTAVSAWLRRHGHTRILWAAAGRLAGGDLLWSKGDVLAGHGRASTAVSARTAGARLGADVIPLALVDARWPTLDQALLPLDDEAALWAPAAFDPTSRTTLESVFPTLHAVEAPSGVVVGDHVVLDASAHDAHDAASAHGLTPVPVDLSAWRAADAGPAALVLPLAPGTA